MTSRKCPVCSSPIIGRPDKKYCSDQCRFLGNNQLKISKDKPILETNRALRKNRSILKTLCPEGMATVRKEILLKMGFNVQLFTSIFVNTQKQVYYICYDYGFTPIRRKGIDKALIVHRQPYMSEWDPWKYVKTTDA